MVRLARVHVTYRCGVGIRMADIGVQPREPHVVCDGCGIKCSAETKTGGPKQWLLKRKAPPGWLMDRTEAAGHIRRKDWCPRCRAHATLTGSKSRLRAR